MGPGPVTAVALVVAYLLGSIPFSYLVARRKGIDVRTVGSGNVGATNVMRSAGRAAGLTAFALDFLKGSLATGLALRFAPNVTVVLLKDTGHWILEERPDETISALSRFLQGGS